MGGIATFTQPIKLHGESVSITVTDENGDQVEQVEEKPQPEKTVAKMRRGRRAS